LSTPNISYLVIDSKSVSNLQSEEINEDKFLTKKHGLDRISLYEDNYLNNNEHVDYVCVGSGSRYKNNRRKEEKNRGRWIKQEDILNKYNRLMFPNFVKIVLNIKKFLFNINKLNFFNYKINFHFIF
jgi:hypothetical protein